MLKNMKLGIKTISGFAIVLILLAVVAYIGYSGMSGVVDRFNKSDDVNRMIKDMLKARQQEKNFIIRGDKGYVDKVLKELTGLKKQANETRDKFKDPVNKKQVDDILAAVGRYEKAFGEYIGIQDKVNHLETLEGNLVRSARRVAQIAETIRQEQKAQYEEMMEGNANAATLEDKLGKADDANRIIKWVLECRRQEKNFLLRGDKEYAGRVDKHVEEIVLLAEDMKSRFERVQNKDQVEKIVTAANGYKAAFDQMAALERLKEEANVKMVEAARATQNIGDEARADQKAKAEAQISNAQTTLFGAGIAAVLLGIVFALFISRTISGGIGRIVGMFKEISDDVANGKLDSRADVEAVGIDFKAIPTGFNAALDAVIGPLNVSAEYVDRISKGDIPEKITDEYKGDFNEIKNNLNLCIEAVNGLVSEAGMLTKSSVEGRLDTRGDAEKFGGDFGRIVQGINATLDAIVVPILSLIHI